MNPILLGVGPVVLAGAVYVFIMSVRNADAANTALEQNKKLQVRLSLLERQVFGIERVP